MKKVNSRLSAFQLACLIPILYVASCNVPASVVIPHVDPKVIYKDSELGDFKVRVIDSCEYIVHENKVVGVEPREAASYSYSLTHKGNCNNPKHHDNKD